MTASTLPVLDLTLGHQPREVRTCLLVWANATAKGLDVTMVGRIGAAKKICFQPTDDPDAVSSGHAKALVDHLRLKNSSGMTGWIESLCGKP